MLLTLLSKASEITIDNDEESLTMIKDKLKDELGIPFEDLINTDNESFIQILVQKKFNLEHLKLLGDILAELYFKGIKVKDTHEKTLILYNYVQNHSTTYAITLQQKILRLNN